MIEARSWEARGLCSSGCPTDNRYSLKKSLKDMKQEVKEEVAKDAHLLLEPKIGDEAAEDKDLLGGDVGISTKGNGV